MRFYGRGSVEVNCGGRKMFSGENSRIPGVAAIQGIPEIINIYSRQNSDHSSEEAILLQKVPVSNKWLDGFRHPRPSELFKNSRFAVL